jgi:hypothetical protein
LKSEITKNDLVIQGILKEAFFEETPFSVQGYTLKLFLTDISESRIRDESASKKIHFKVSGKHSFVKGQALELSAKFHRYTVKGNYLLDQVDEDELIFKIPSELVLENLRKSSRTQLPNDLRTAISVFVRTGAAHTEGSFIPDDVSAEGFGGQLWLTEGFPIDSTSVIKGALQKNGTVAEFEGAIINARILPSDRNGFSLYKIGTQQRIVESVNMSGAVERRAQRRYQTNIQFSLRSRLFPEQVLVLDVNDVSINGFSGRVASGSVISHVPVGSVFKIEGESTDAHLIHFSNDRFHFQVRKRSVEDGVNWLKKLTPLIDPKARSSTRDLRELYRVFLQAGAVSTQYLKRHQLHQSLLVGQSASNDSSYVHRWYLGEDQDKADGYLSAIRTSNTSWILGDIAKVNESELKLKSSIQKFFHSFSEFASASNSIGTLGIVWVKGHPFWQSWYDELKERHNESISSDLKMNYYRSAVNEGMLDPTIEVQEIKKSDYQIRNGIFTKLSPAIRSYLRHSFDFSEDGLGSYSFAREADWFFRRYFEVTVGKNRYLTIATAPAPGISVNRYLDSLFVIPIQILNETTLEKEVIELGKAVSTKLGLAIPSVRVVHDSSYLFGGTEMVSLLMYPSGFSSF